MQPLISEEELLEGNREFMKQYVRPPEPPPRPANVGTVLGLLQPMELRLLRYRLRRFLVPPVPYADAIELQAYQIELAWLEQPTDDLAQRVVNLRRELEVLKASAAIMLRLVRPVGLWDRLTWRWRANPFRGGEVSELQELFNFFCAAPTTPRILWNWARGAAPGLQTWRPILPTLPGSILH